MRWLRDLGRTNEYLPKKNLCRSVHYFQARIINATSWWPGLDQNFRWLITYNPIPTQVDGHSHRGLQDGPLKWFPIVKMKIFPSLCPEPDPRPGPYVQGGKAISMKFQSSKTTSQAFLFSVSFEIATFISLSFSPSSFRFSPTSCPRIDPFFPATSKKRFFLGREIRASSEELRRWKIRISWVSISQSFFEFQAHVDSDFLFFSFGFESIIRGLILDWFTLASMICLYRSLI